MRGRKGKVDSPGMVISTGMFMALVALVRIMRDRTNKRTKKFFLRVEKMWTTAREALKEMTFLDKIGFSPIQTAESNMRGQQHKFSFTSLRRFGNKETKRVYSWLEGTVGPFNALLNYAGARLRELAMIFYPFPRPQAFQIREYPDGTIKVYTKTQAEKTGDDGAIKTYWRYGYERSGKTPRVFLAHPTLPGLDFVDMIRAHCVELCRQCFIYHVPRTEAHRYIRLLIHRLKPFLDWVYTDGQEGRSGFNPYADQELRKIVLEIRALYTKRSRTRQRISNRGRERTNSLTYDSIRKTVISQLEETTDKSKREALLTFLDYFDTATVPEGEGTEAVFGAIQKEILKRMGGTDNEKELNALKKLNRIIKTISSEDKEGKTPFERIREKIIKQVSKATDATEREHLFKLLDYLDIRAGVIQDRDIEKLAEQVLALAQREGNEWHRVLFSDLHHPASLRQVVFVGDKMLDSLSSVLVVAELPVARHSGMVDITIFIRREVEGQVLWTPVMILEVKTKTAFDLNLYGFRLKRKREQVSTPAFYAWKRATSEKEWDEIISSGPDKPALNQLVEYERELLAEYREIATHDSTPPSSLWKGVIVLDTNQSPIETFQAFQYLLEELTTGFIHQLVDQDSSVAVTPEPLHSGDDAPKVAMFIASSNGPESLLSEMIPPTSLPIEDPFFEREPDDRELTLYVSLASPTSSGVTAARLSRNWHLLHHIKECQETSRTPIEVVWLDLLGDYKNNELLKKRMGLDVLLSGKMISPETHLDLSNALRSIRFVDLSMFCTEIIVGDADEVTKLSQHIRTLLPEMEKDRIIILDGWSDFRDMVPGHHQYQIRSLEQRLLDSLPQSNVNIIWIDSGKSHTKMNGQYQRECIKPLRYDSPRRMHLDEIIYNVPSVPWRFGWMTPQQEAVRIIVQDTPTQAAPWKVAIHVPQLVGFGEKFRGLARRDGIVPSEVVAQDHINLHPMHGRGVTLSSTYVSSNSFSGKSLNSLLYNALTLVPSVLRQRTSVDEEDFEKKTSSKEDLWQTAVQTVNSSGGSSMTGRVRVDTTRPPPRPKGSKRYFDTLTELKTGNITRPWSYHRTPKQIPDEDDEEGFSVSTYVPDVKLAKAEKIDTIETRRRELRRLYYAARHLKGHKSVSKQLRECCKKIEQYSKNQHKLAQEEPSLNTSEFFLRALLNIQQIILEDSYRTEVWNMLQSSRQKLPEFLTSENRKILQEVWDGQQDLFTLYGNNLFLAVVAALGDSPLLLAEPLWNSVAEWTFRQIGMNVQDEVRYVCSFQAIVSNLRSRIKTLSQLKLLAIPLTKQEKVGAIIWKGKEAPITALLLIPSEVGYLTALIEGISNRRLSGRWSKCVTTSQKLMKFAQEALSSSESLPVIQSVIEETPVLWVPWMDEEEGQIHWDLFLFEHGKPAGRRKVVPWLKLEHLPFEVSRDVPEIPDTFDKFLREMAQIRQVTLQVRPWVRIDHDREVYEVNFEGGSIEEHLEFSQTQELVKFLRTPIWSGTGFRFQNKALTWSHKEDIDYGEGLSFLKPLVRWSRFYPDVYQYPRTCEELLEMEVESEVTMVLKKEVDWLRGDVYRIELRDLPKKPTLSRLESLELTRAQLVLLTECEELFDTDAGVKHPVKLDVSEVMHLRFPETSEDSQLDKAFKVENEYRYEEDISSLENREEEYVEEDHDEYEVEEEDTGKVSEIYGDAVFRYIRLEVGDNRVVIWLETEDGDIVDIPVNTRMYQEYSDKIDLEEIKTIMNKKLVAYDLDDDELETIIDEMRDALEEKGVRFFEEKSF